MTHPSSVYGFPSPVLFPAISARSPNPSSRQRLHPTQPSPRVASSRPLTPTAGPSLARGSPAVMVASRNHRTHKVDERDAASALRVPIPEDVLQTHDTEAEGVATQGRVYIFDACHFQVLTRDFNPMLLEAAIDFAQEKHLTRYFLTRRNHASILPHMNSTSKGHQRPELTLGQCGHHFRGVTRDRSQEQGREVGKGRSQNTIPKDILEELQEGLDSPALRVLAPGGSSLSKGPQPKRVLTMGGSSPRAGGPAIIFCRGTTRQGGTYSIRGAGTLHFL